MNWKRPLVISLACVGGVWPSLGALIRLTGTERLVVLAETRQTDT